MVGVGAETGPEGRAEGGAVGRAEGGAFYGGGRSTVMSESTHCTAGADGEDADCSRNEDGWFEKSRHFGLVRSGGRTY